MTDARTSAVNPSEQAARLTLDQVVPDPGDGNGRVLDTAELRAWLLPRARMLGLTEPRLTHLLVAVCDVADDIASAEMPWSQLRLWAVPGRLIAEIAGTRDRRGNPPDDMSFHLFGGREHIRRKLVDDLSVSDGPGGTRIRLGMDLDVPAAGASHQTNVT